MIKRIIIPWIGFALVIGGCHNKAVPVITSRTEFPPPPKSSGKTMTENSPEAVAAGKIIFETRCNRCHDLKTVDVYTPQRWSTILQTMIPRARLNEEQSVQLRSYVMTNSKK